MLINDTNDAYTNYIFCDCPSKQRINVKHGEPAMCLSCGQVYIMLGALVIKGNKSPSRDTTLEEMRALSIKYYTYGMHEYN